MLFDITKKRTGLTRIDCAVAVACVVFVLANVPVIVAGGRGRAKLEVCMANLRALTAAWSMYADDHQGRIPCADILYCEVVPGSPIDSKSDGVGWYRYPHEPDDPTSLLPDIDTGSSPPGGTEEEWKTSIAEGSIWNYLRNYNIYRCPVGMKREYVTYTIAHSMNAWNETGLFGTTPSMEIYIRTQIRHPAQRMVFGDQGYSGTGAYAVQYSVEEFWDPPCMAHGFGQPTSFADGHVEYRKWTDDRTKKMDWAHKGDSALCNCNQDLYWLQWVVWGGLGYTPPCAPEF